MKKTTMISINKLQKHIKNKKYMIWVEGDFKRNNPEAFILESGVFSNWI